MRILLLSALAVCSSTGLAEDRVVLQPGGRYSSRITVRGEVENYTGAVLRLRLKAGVPIKEYPAREVVQIETPQTEPHRTALKLLAEADFDGAAREFEKGLAAEERAWVRREILTELLKLALRRGDYAAAGARFAVISQSDPTTSAFRLLPLNWGTTELTPALREQAIAWLGAEAEPLQLLGASYLLEEAQWEQPAQTALRDLATSTDRRVQVLAQAQQWRPRLRSAQDLRGEVGRWQVRIEAMPEELRGGPYFLLGRARLLQREYELAAYAFLWTPLVAPDDRRLASRACLAAADALHEIGQHPAAATLYREVVEKYADTPAAELASDRLQTEDEPSPAATKPAAPRRKP